MTLLPVQTPEAGIGPIPAPPYVELMLACATVRIRVSSVTAELALRGLKPIHAKATANAKRLGRR